MAIDIDAPRTCTGCEKEKQADQFRLFGRGRKKICIDCEGSSPGSTNASGRKKGKRGRKSSAESGGGSSDSFYQRPGGMGFSVQLEVDENTKLTDIKVAQYNPTAQAEQTIWLNQLEARELQSWLTEQLGA